MAFCVHCGVELHEQGSFCPSCGKSNPDPTTDIAQSSEEKIFYQNDSGIFVTNTRFVVPGKTYAMSNITSVSQLNIKAKRGIPIAIAIIGLPFLFQSEVRPFGLTMLLIGAIWILKVKNQFAVSLSSASGESHAFTDKNQQYIQTIVNAINQAIVYRK